MYLPLLKNKGNPASRVTYDSRPEQRLFSQRAFSTQSLNNAAFFLSENNCIYVECLFSNLTDKRRPEGLLSFY